MPTNERKTVVTPGHRFYEEQIALLRGEYYQIDAAGRPTAPEADAARVEARLRAARSNADDDSPLFQLLEGMPRLQIDHSKTDIFREQVAYSEDWKARLAQARHAGASAVRALAADPGLAGRDVLHGHVLIDDVVREPFHDLLDIGAAPVGEILFGPRLTHGSSSRAVNTLEPYTDGQISDIAARRPAPGLRSPGLR